jgi:hypothetical protein
LKDIFAPGKGVVKSSKDVFARTKDVFKGSKDVSAQMQDVFKKAGQADVTFSTSHLFSLRSGS